MPVLFTTIEPECPVQCLLHGRTQYFFFFNFWQRQTACGILVPRPGIEPAPSAVKARSPNHRTAREFPQYVFQGMKLDVHQQGNAQINCNTSKPLAPIQIKRKKKGGGVLFSCHLQKCAQRMLILIHFNQM